MPSRPSTSARLRLEPFEDRLCLSGTAPTDQFSRNDAEVESSYCSAGPTAGVGDPGPADLAGEAGSQEAIGTHGYIRIKKLNSGG